MTTYVHRDQQNPDLRQAYEMGRRDARQSRRRHPVLMAALVVIAAVGLIFLALAAVNGSFGGAGSVVDQNLAIAAEQAEPAVRNAAAEAGEAVRDITTNDRTDPAVPVN